MLAEAQRHHRKFVISQQRSVHVLPINDMTICSEYDAEEACLFLVCSGCRHPFGVVDATHGMAVANGLSVFNLMIDFTPDQRRPWGKWLLGCACALALVAAITDNDGRSLWWPPVLASAFAATAAAYVVDAYRNGIAQGRFGLTVDRVREPTMFKLTVITYGLLTALLSLMAVGLWWDVLAGHR